MNAIMNTIATTIVGSAITTAIHSSLLSTCMTDLNNCDGQINMGQSVTVNLDNETIEASYLQSKPSGQDFVTSVKGVYKNEPFTGLVVIDGHGKSDVIDTLRGLDYRELLESDNLLEEINSYICDSAYNEDLFYTRNSGAVISIVQIFKDRYVMKWMGDCKIHIRVNGTIIATSSSHNFVESNVSKQASRSNTDTRSNISPILINDYTIQVLDEKRITMKPSKKFRYPYSDMGPVSMTRALGHSQKIGNDLGFETRVIPRVNSPSCSIHFEDIVVYSDGIGDMVCEDDIHTVLSNTTEDTIKMCDKRWRQEWIYVFGDSQEKACLSDGDFDDMSIVKWSSRNMCPKVH